MSTNFTVHSRCDRCDEFPIIGKWKWKCLQCADFDLCSSCYDQLGNRHGHRFLRIQNPQDLEKRVFQKSIAEVNGTRHHGVECDNCLESPIIGIRWKCSQCADFDLCTSCLNFNLHQHRFFRSIESPQNLTPITANNLQTRHVESKYMDKYQPRYIEGQNFDQIKSSNSNNQWRLWCCCCKFSWH